MDRYLTTPIERYDFLYNIFENEHTLYNTLVFLMKYAFYKQSENAYDKLFKTLKDAL